MTEFGTWLDVATSGNTNEAAGVDLVSFHRAKGLEWTLVFVTGLERGMVPISWAVSAAAQDEERRLLHVALSRAQDELRCSWACTRAVGSRRAPREPSPWLGLLENAANHAPARPVAGTQHSARPPGRAACHSGRRHASGAAARTLPPAQPLICAPTAENVATPASSDRRRPERPTLREPTSNKPPGTQASGKMYAFDADARRLADLIIDLLQELVALDPAPLNGTVLPSEVATRARKLINAEGNDPASCSISSPPCSRRP